MNYVGNSSKHLTTLRRAFNLVKNPVHWQEPINAKISLDKMSKEKVSVDNIKEAIEFYTASIPSVNVEGKKVFIKAKGYRLSN